jgi:putative endonuclease
MTTQAPTIARGRLGERLAADHLVRAGYRILARNFRTARGEVNLIAEGPSCLVFCEVKTRIAGSRAGPPGPLDSIGPLKRRQVRRMAVEWLHEHGGEPRRRWRLLRFDAIGVTLTAAGEVVAIEHLEGAF